MSETTRFDQLRERLRGILPHGGTGTLSHENLRRDLDELCAAAAAPRQDGALLRELRAFADCQRRLHDDGSVAQACYEAVLREIDELLAAAKPPERDDDPLRAFIRRHERHREALVYTTEAEEALYEMCQRLLGREAKP